MNDVERFYRCAFDCTALVESSTCSDSDVDYTNAGGFCAEEAETSKLRRKVNRRPPVHNILDELFNEGPTSSREGMTLSVLTLSKHLYFHSAAQTEAELMKCERTLDGRIKCNRCNTTFALSYLHETFDVAICDLCRCDAF